MCKRRCFFSRGFNAPTGSLSGTKASVLSGSDYQSLCPLEAPAPPSPFLLHPNRSLISFGVCCGLLSPRAQDGHSYPALLSQSYK